MVFYWWLWLLFVLDWWRHGLLLLDGRCRRLLVIGRRPILSFFPAHRRGRIAEEQVVNILFEIGFVTAGIEL